MAIISLTLGDDDILASAEGAVTGDVILGLEGDDIIEADVADITVDGGDGSDTLVASADNVTLYGGDGDVDVLQSNAGVDGTTMEGGAGDDELLGFGANDTASYANDPAGVTVNLSAGLATDGFGNTDILFRIENVTGSAFADTLTGDPGANVLNGGAGNDRLTGGDGADVFKYSFTLTQEGETFRFTDFLSEKFGRDFGDELPDASVHHHNHHHHKHGKDDEHRGDDDHHHHHHHKHKHKHDDDDEHHAHADAGGLTEKFFEKNYKEWLKEVVVPDLLAQGFVLDANGNGKIKIDINEDSPDGTPIIEGLTEQQLAELFGDRDSVILRDGRETEEAFYSNSYTSPGGQDTVASTDGFDNIVDFDFAEDKLEFNGLGADFTVDQFRTLFKVAELEVGGNASLADMKLFLVDDNNNDIWSVTLLDVGTKTHQEFFDAGVFS